MLRASWTFIIILGLCIPSCEGGGPSGTRASAFVLSDTSIDFSGEGSQQAVTISNLSSDPLDWRVLSTTASWLSAFPGGGIVPPGATGTFVIRIDRAVLPDGTFSAELQIEAAGQTALIEVFVQETPASSPVALVQPSALTIGPLDVSRVVEVSNTGGSTLTWTGTGPPWVTLAPGSGSVAPGGRSQILVTPDRTGLTGGTYSGTLQFVSNGGSPTVALELVVSGLPALAIEPSRLDFGVASDQTVMHVRNDGDEPLQWAGNSTATWVTVSPASGTLQPGQSQSLTVNVSRSGLPPGQNEATIEFTSNGGSAVAVVTAEVESGGVDPPPPDPPHLVVSPAFLDFHGSATELSVSVDNDGDEPLVWSADPDASWISVPLSAGTVSPHSSASVAVRVSRSGLTAGTYQSALQFTSNGGSATVTIDMTVSGSPPDTTSPPEISLNPISLDFGSATAVLPVVIENTGGKPLVWQAEPADAFVSVLPAPAGTVAPHASASVVVRVSRSGLTAGTYASALQFTSNGGSATVTIDLTVSGSPPDTTSPPKIGLTPTSLNFGLTATVLPVVIQNTGGKPLDWQAEPADGFVSVSPSSGQVEPGDAESVAIAVSRSGLLAGLHESSILFTSNGGNKLLPLSLLVEEDDPGPGFCDLGSPPGGGSPIKAKVLACGASANVTSATLDISAAAQTLVLVWVGSASEGSTNPPSVHGGGLTWDLVATHVRNAEARRLSVFRGMSSTPVHGLLTVDFGGQEQQALGWGVVEYSGVDVSGVNGSGAIVQVGTGAAELLETLGFAGLAPFSSPNNATVGGFFAGANHLSPGAGFVEMFEAGLLKRTVMVEFKPSPDTSVDASWLEGAHWLAIALELESR
jgi:P pilus assembly chaperone PapD